MNLKKFSPQYYILSSTTIYCRSLPLITALLFQEEIEYTRALDDQDGSSFWRPSLLQFNNITFYLQVHYALYTITHTLDILSGDFQFNNITFYLRFIIHYTLYTIHQYTRYSFWRLSV